MYIQCTVLQNPDLKVPAAPPRHPQTMADHEVGVTRHHGPVVASTAVVYLYEYSCTSTARRTAFSTVFQQKCGAAQAAQAALPGLADVGTASLRKPWQALAARQPRAARVEPTMANLGDDRRHLYLETCTSRPVQNTVQYQPPSTSPRSEPSTAVATVGHGGRVGVDLKVAVL